MEGPITAGMGNHDYVCKHHSLTMSSLVHCLDWLYWLDHHHPRTRLSGFSEWQLVNIQLCSLICRDPDLHHPNYWMEAAQTDEGRSNFPMA